MSAPLSTGQDWFLANPQWAQILNPIITAPYNNAVVIIGINLIAGVNTINHGLGRLLIGWSIVDRTGPATIYRSAPLNALTLTLTSSAAVTISLEVF